MNFLFFLILSIITLLLLAFPAEEDGEEFTMPVYDWKVGKAKNLRIEERYNRMKNAHWLSMLNEKYSIKIEKFSKEELRDIFGRFGK